MYSDENFYERLKKAQLKNIKLFERFKKAKQLFNWDIKIPVFTQEGSVKEFVDIEGYNNDIVFRKSKKFIDIFSKFESDMIINNKVIEIKGRNLVFVNKSSFPFKSIIIDTAYGFDKKKIKPDIYIVYSYKTNKFLWIPVEKTKSLWKIESVFDTDRKQSFSSYILDKKYWYDEASIVKIFENV